MQDWQQLLSFLQEELTNAEVKGYPKTLIKMIDLLRTGAEIIYPMVMHLQDPENSARKVCAFCGQEFWHTNQWVKTCSIRCHKKWLADPNGYLSDKTNTRSTLYIINELECQEESQP